MEKKKRIFLTLAANASSGFNDLTFKFIFYDTLVRMGHDVCFMPYHEASDSRQDLNAVSGRIFDRFLAEHTRKPFDLFLSYYHSGQVTPELFRKVREKVYCINYTTNFHQINLYKPLLGEADLSVYVSKAAEGYFREHGFKGYYMPFAGLGGNLPVKTPKNGRVSFTGTSYGPRALYIWRCLQNNLPIDIYGANWVDRHQRRAVLRTLRLESQALRHHPMAIDTAFRTMNDLILREITEKYGDRIHGPLGNEAYTSLLSESSIVLNIPESRHGHDFSNPNVLIGANLRDFEVPAAGSFLLTQDNDEIRSCFESGTEIGTFSNEWEMVDKARFYLARPDLILKIAAAGHERLRKEHLWEHRFSALFSYLDSNFL